MSFQTKIYLIIIGLWVVNYLPRAIPMVILSKMKIPEPVVQWLSFVPAAVLAAIIAPSILMPEKHMLIGWQNKYLVTAFPAFAVAIKTRSLVWTLLAGMLVMAILQL